MGNEKAWFVRRLVLSVLFLVVVTVPLFPELFGLDELTPFTQVAAFRPQAVAVVLVLALLMLVRRGWRIAAGLIGVLALIGAALTAPRQFSAARPAPAGSRVLTIMVANVFGGGARATDVAQLIRDRKPDLVSLPEAQADVREKIRALLPDQQYKGYTDQPSSAAPSATSVLVSPALGGVAFASEPGTTFGNIVVTGGNLGAVRLIAYHGYPPLPDAVATWAHDLLKVREWCSQDPPTVIAGDYNATVDHAYLRSALGGYCRSVGPSVGGGLDGTWPADQPAVLRTQIDHVVVTRQFEPGTFTTYSIHGTDHRAVVATIALKT
ncbi:endonuclease/exonuclease/phosphatase (EEP) superfamily protein YafD [Kribbella aluminosa]|uniref:Endonuclease/exonuclease/phosphatase (EEP) superfamily protein YafD n=1 Tax=Kribbella aluminosa TaxID=416017 RepID=A0ABS4UG73_9ACTN|nr:endonuclease/exonuclease/phosphatase family protein [Kribbella aluminosa]MBP2350644.1 endonuclease/exonuclease/phosphatase (EEP) superfamily protein YafD [Kribbella aluminosa]